MGRQDKGKKMVIKTYDSRSFLKCIRGIQMELLHSQRDDAPTRHHMISSETVSNRNGLYLWFIRGAPIDTPNIN